MEGAKSRMVVVAAACTLVAGFMAYAFWPRALLVDIGVVSRGPLMVAISEEAKTRVREEYVVSAPVSGRLLRVDVEPGDAVYQGETVIARLTPTRPAVLDVRTEEQARAAVGAAEAAIVLARAEERRASADADYARLEADRARSLLEKSAISQVTFDRAERARRVADAALETAQAAVAMRIAELEHARAMLMSPSDAERAALSTNPHPRESIPLIAPISGKVLRVIRESETVVAAGSPIVEIGDPKGDLEIVAELLSPDAVRISPGDRVIIEKWGGGGALDGVVDRIEPWGFTKFSALGVEEQRVNAVIQFTGDAAGRERLGHGFRAEVRIVIWENEAALKIPSSAVFRSGGDWAAFQVIRGRARLTELDLGADNGVETEVLGGLRESDRIVIYPGNRVKDGARVKKRDPE